MTTFKAGDKVTVNGREWGVLEVAEITPSGLVMLTSRPQAFEADALTLVEPEAAPAANNIQIAVEDCDFGGYYARVWFDGRNGARFKTYGFGDTEEEARADGLENAHNHPQWQQSELEAV